MFSCVSCVVNPPPACVFLPIPPRSFFDCRSGTGFPMIRKVHPIESNSWLPELVGLLRSGWNGSVKQVEEQTVKDDKSREERRNRTLNNGHGYTTNSNRIVSHLHTRQGTSDFHHQQQQQQQHCLDGQTYICLLWFQRTGVKVVFTPYFRIVPICHSTLQFSRAQQ